MPLPERWRRHLRHQAGRGRVESLMEGSSAECTAFAIMNRHVCALACSWLTHHTRASCSANEAHQGR